MAEYFSDKLQSAAYAKYITSLPEIAISEAIEFLKDKCISPLTNALDVGCGTGNSTRLIAPYFEKVLGIDLSATQLDEARNDPLKPPNVNFLKSPAEVFPLEDNSVQLVSVCQALHWFDLDRFLAEVKRVLVPNGVLIVWIQSCLQIPVMVVDEEKSKKFLSIRQEFWDKPISPYDDTVLYEMLWKFYDNLDLGVFFETVIKKNHKYRINSTLRNYIGMFTIWPNFVKMRNENPELAESIISRFIHGTEDVFGSLDTEIIMEMQGDIFLCRNFRD